MCNWVKSGNQRIDPCLRASIKNFNSLGESIGIKTVACCCGHGKYPPTIIIQKPDGTIRDWWTNIIIPRKKRFYKRDSEGHFFIPEIAVYNSEKNNGKK